MIFWCDVGTKSNSLFPSCFHLLDGAMAGLLKKSFNLLCSLGSYGLYSGPVGFFECCAALRQWGNTKTPSIQNNLQLHIYQANCHQTRLELKLFAWRIYWKGPFYLIFFWCCTSGLFYHSIHFHLSHVFPSYLSYQAYSFIYKAPHAYRKGLRLVIYL